MALTEAEWLKVKKLASQEVPITAIAKRFGVTYGAIWSRLKAEEKPAEKPKLTSRATNDRRRAASSL